MNTLFLINYLTESKKQEIYIKFMNSWKDCAESGGNARK